MAKHWLIRLRTILRSILGDWVWTEASTYCFRTCFVQPGLIIMVEKDNQVQPVTGGYYWFPSHVLRSVTWTVLTCHELGCDADVGHLDLWTLVLDQLAQAWQRDARLLKKRLMNHLGPITDLAAVLIILRAAPNYMLFTI